mmetsp:Transcript_37812/g.61486  ORF Transcript_37812/g.61486 Transcript_37812/m.61486 type:complete len:197 (-) Transcript_37812:979-1569(-)
MSRPEHTAPAERFYNKREAHKYTESGRLVQIQRSMAKRAVELLNLPKGKSCLLLDIGCGSAISSEQISREGHVWFGCDISRAMLELAKNRSSSKGDLAEVDMGVGIPCRSGSFDGAISISAVQWLCVKQTPTQNPTRRLNKFFKSLRRCLVFDGRAALQLYPENPDQMNAILAAAKKAGFDGSKRVDVQKYFVNSR